jgi:hypothetical protein
MQLETAGVKWNHAREKGLTLLCDWIAFLQTNPFPPYAVHYPGSGSYGVGFDFPASVPVPITVTAGEIAHNLRSVLNNLVTAAAIKFCGRQLTRAEERKLDYVIALTPGEFAARTEKMRPFLSDGAMSIMAQNQPHSNAPSLLLLHGFNRKDKHSGINVAQPAAPPPLPSIEQFFVCARGVRPLAVEPLLDEWTPLAGRTELVRVKFPPEIADPRIRVVSTPTLHLVFDRPDEQIKYTGGMAMIEDVGRVITEFAELLT